MDKVKIYIACHKPCNVPKNNVYTPIHVGRSISKYKEDMAHMIGDNIGDNISDKNPFYSELTAQYWVWKNIKDTEYVGFCHYRRFFEKTFTENNIDKFFINGTDVLLAGPMLRTNGRFNHLKNFVNGEDLAIMLYVIKKMYPDYYSTLSNYALGYIDYPLNMFVCRKALFDEYAKWIFNILFECEKFIKPSPYSRARRVYGYLSEFLMPIYYIHNNYRIQPINYVLENGKIRGGIPFLTRMKMDLIDFIYWKGKKKPLIGIDYSIKAGLEADHIISFNNINL